MNKMLKFLLLPILAFSLMSCDSNNDTEEDTGYGIHFYNGYYEDIATWEDGEDLKQKLYTILHDGYQPLKYTSPTNWETNQYADQALDDFEKVDILYDSENKDKSNTNTGWQREHAFAASLMTGKLTSEAVGTLGRATDFHNLFAASSTGNGSRGNKNFGMANPENENYTPVSNSSSLDYSYDDINFEPSDYDKGRLARSIFYMGVMYSVSESVLYQPLTIQEEPVVYSPDNPPYAIGNLSTLLDWNNFSVDRLEYQHNESVHSHVHSGTNKAQGNRNPFVDYPDLVDYVYGDKKNESGALTDLKPSYLELEIDKGDEIANYAISNAKRNYNVGETFSKADYTLVEVTKDFTVRPNTTFTDTTANYSFSSSDIGIKTFNIVTPNNTIKLPVKVADPDPMNSTSYLHVLTGKTNGGDLTGFSKGGTVTLSGTSWKIDWSNANADIYQYQSKWGVLFGKSSNPVNSFTMETISSISVDAFYAKISCASGKTINYSLTIGNTTIASGSVTRPSGADGPVSVGTEIETPINGILKLTINGSGATQGSIIVHSLAYNAI